MISAGIKEALCRTESALVLDLDGSVFLPGEIARLDLRSYEEKIRYFAGFGNMERLGSYIHETVRKHRIFFIGNGDFHHVSYLLIKQIPENIQVVVFDNHPDNMFFPAGIHCGSWVYHASKLPNVSGVTVFGISSRDLSGLNLIQNRFSALRAGKVRYYCLTPVARLARLLSGSKVEDISESGESVVEILKEHISSNASPVYLSVDKDVLMDGVVRTGWDQGRMTEKELLECIKAIAPNIIAADIVGDISSYKYKSHLKRFLRWIDGSERLPEHIDSEKLRHGDINMKILSLLKDINP